MMGYSRGDAVLVLFPDSNLRTAVIATYQKALTATD